MSNLVPLEAIDRRELIRKLALAMTAMGSLDLAGAQHVHEETRHEKAAKGAYTPKALKPHEYKTVTRLAELIVPADDVSGSAVDAGAPEFIDLLCSQNEQLADIYHGGLAWLDVGMRKRHGKSFLEAGEAHQTEMLDALVAAGRTERERRGEELVYRRSPDYKDFSGYTVNRAGELGPGIHFFDWVRKMSVDAFYTSPIGIKDLGYLGNRAVSKYEVPAECLEYALKRSPFA